MSGPPLAQGGVLVTDGLITAVGDAARLAPDAGRQHHIDGVLLPGLVNGHTHLELADAAALAVPGPFAAWLQAVEGTVAQWSDERWGRSAHRGVLQSLRAGTTAVFDTVLRGTAVPAACRAGLAGDSFVEVDDVDVDAADDVLAQVEHALTLPAEGRRVGIAPASPARLGTGALQSLTALAKRTDTPVQIHAAQVAAEMIALREGTGVYSDRARTHGRSFEWLEGGGPTPVRYLEALGALGERTSLVHAVHVDLGETRLLGRLGVAVVCCPRANERLRMGTPPLELFADARVRMALGTESLAAAPDADVLGEAAAWVRLAQGQGLHLWPSGAGPVPLTEAAVRLATTDGARALGWGASCGALEPGRRADLVGIAVATTAEHAYRDLIAQGAGRQVLTVIGGVRKARRDSADHAWPDIDDDSWRTA